MGLCEKLLVAVCCTVQSDYNPQYIDWYLSELVTLLYARLTVYLRLEDKRAMDP